VQHHAQEAGLETDYVRGLVQKCGLVPESPRGLLGREQAVLRQEGQLSVDGRLCWVDVWAVERLLGRAETASNYTELIRKAAVLYPGAFLDEREVELP
jgi:hypothetical protein